MARRLPERFVVEIPVLANQRCCFTTRGIACRVGLPGDLHPGSMGPCREVERGSHNEERDREVDEHPVLGVLGEEYGLDVEWMQGLSSFTARRLCPSSSGESSRSTGMFLLC